MQKKKLKEIKDYDKNETSYFIDQTKALQLRDLNIELPEEDLTKVVSMRLPTSLLNKIKAYASQNDVSYASLIKLLLSEAIEKKYN